MKRTIFHYGNLAGLPYTLAKAQRNAGYKAISIMPSAEDPGGVGIGKARRALPTDEVLYSRGKKLRGFLKKLALVFRVLRHGGMVHYYGTTILPWALDADLFKFFNIPMIITWGGGDARIISEACKANPYFYRYDEPEKDRRIRKMLLRVSAGCQYVATDPEMATYSKPYFDAIFPYFQPIDLETVTLNFPDPDQVRPKILHIPTHPHVKGTPHIQSAVSRLLNEGYDFEFNFMEPNLTQQEVRNAISNCDIYVDELRCGSYGVTAVEAMASGKPTLTYILDSVVAEMPSDLPIVNANPDTVYDQLKKLIESGLLRYEIGKNSREYVEKYHEASAVASRMIEVYSKIGFNPS